MDGAGRGAPHRAVIARRGVLVGLGAALALPARAQDAGAETDARLELSYLAPEAGVPGGYLARPRGPGDLPGVVVLHDRFGPAARAAARRTAAEGFVAFACDTADADAAAAAVRWLARGRRTAGGVGVLGYGAGGAVANRMAVTMGRALRAGVAFYGDAPSPRDAAAVAAPLMLHFAGRGGRVNPGGRAWVAALQRSGGSVTAFFYPEAAPGFGEMVENGAGRLSWERTVEFLHVRLG